MMGPTEAMEMAALGVEEVATVDVGDLEEGFKAEVEAVEADMGVVDGSLGYLYWDSAKISAALGTGKGQ